MANWAYWLVMYKDQGSSHVDFYFRIDQWALLQSTMAAMCNAGWEEYATYTYSGYWLYTGGGSCPCSDE
jgi:hypothetical protein